MSNLTNVYIEPFLCGRNCMRNQKSVRHGLYCYMQGRILIFLYKKYKCNEDGFMEEQHPSFLQQISMKFYYRSITIKVSGHTEVKT